MKILKSLLSTRVGNAALVSLLSFLVYLKTLAPSVTFIDAGELAAVAYTLGIAHPTGYPLFTLLGWVFARLPIASEEIVRLNVMAAFFCAVGVFLFYHLVHWVLTMVFTRTSFLKFKRKEILPLAIRVSSAGAALLLAFSETYWSQAVAIEVYSLHVLFLSLVLLSFFKAVFDDKGDQEESGQSSNRWWYAFAFFLGLSFTNHMTTILLAPGLLYLYFATQGFDAGSWKRMGRMTIPFLAGFSVYLYLPLRAMQSPVLNWGNPVSLEKFLWHWTGKQYRVWIFSSTESARRQLSYFIESLPDEFAYIGLALAIAGVIVLWRAQRRIAIAFLLLFFGCVFYSINYDIHDIDSYFLLAYFCIAILAAVGLLWVFRWLSESVNVTVAAVACIVLSLATCVLHYEKTDESNNHLVEDYTKNMFSSLGQNALVLSYQWDYWVSASFYYQLVKNFRPDVTVVDKELLRRSWYFKQLKHRHPWLIENSRAEVEAFLKELDKFEHDRPYNPSVIQARFVDMIRSFLANNLATRPVYVTPEIESEFTAGLQRVPEGLAYRVYNDTLHHQMRSVEFVYRPFERSGRLEDALRNLYAAALNARAMYRMKEGKIDSALAAYRKALEFNPNSREAMHWLQQVEHMRMLGK